MTARAAICTALLLTACAKTPAPLDAPAQTTQPEAISIPADLNGVEITLERTECFGSCPNYKVTIDGGGHVKYVGRSWVVQKGERETTVDTEELRALLQRFVHAGFFSLEDQYEQAVTDCATTFLTVRIGERHKRVKNYWSRDPMDFAPEDFDTCKVHFTLDMLAYCVDRVADSGRWVGDEDDRRKLKDPEGFPGRTELPK
jgi:Domain of unknown function (DUF6438)